MHVPSSNPPWNLLDLKSKGPPCLPAPQPGKPGSPAHLGNSEEPFKAEREGGGGGGCSGPLYFEILFASGELDRLQPPLRWELGEAGPLLVPSGSR